MKKRKRWIAFLLAAAMSVSLIGCGGSGATGESGTGDGRMTEEEWMK